MRIVGVLLAIGLAVTSVHGQQIGLELGGEAGVPLTRPTPEHSPLGPSTVTFQGPRLTGAPSLTLSVDNRISVSVEVLFRPVRYEIDTVTPSISTFDTTRATALEVPVIVAYHFGHQGLRPFLGAGVISYEQASGRIDAHAVLHDQGDKATYVVFPYQAITSLTTPLIVDGGVDYRKGRWTLRPEARYTNSQGSSGRRPDQWDVLVGVTFRVFQWGKRR